MAARPFYVKFTPSTSADVVAYRIYAQKTPDQLQISPASPNVIVPGPFAPDPADGKISIDLQPLFPDLDGQYLIGISAIDDADNESGILEGMTTVDFVVPAAPTDIEFVSG